MENENTPVAYLLAEKREDRWVLGDDWSPEFKTQAEAEERAAAWRALGRGRPIAVLAVTVVTEWPAYEYAEPEERGAYLR